MPLMSNGSFARDSNSLDITFSVTPDERRNQQAIEMVVEEIRQALNKEFGFNIEAGNIDEVLRQLDELGVKIKGFKDSSGYISSVTTSFKNANDTVLTLNSNIRSTIKTIEQLSEEAGKKVTVADLYRTRQGVDSSGEIVTDWNKRGSIVGVLDQSISTSTSYAKEQETVIERLIQQYQTLRKEMSKVGTVGWTEEVASRVEYLRRNIEELKQETQEYIKSNNLQGTDYSAQVQRTIDRNEYDAQTKVYQEQLKIIDQIREAELKLASADNEQTVRLNEQITSLKEKQAILERLGVSGGQQYVIDNYKKESEALKQSIELAKSKDEQQKLYISTLNELANIEKRLDSLDSDKNTEEIAYLKTRKAALENVKDGISEEVKLTEQSKQAFEAYNKVVSESAAKRIDKLDYQKQREDITSYIGALKELESIEKQIASLKTDDTKQLEELNKRKAALESFVSEKGKEVTATKEVTTALEHYYQISGQIEAKQADTKAQETKNQKIKEYIENIKLLQQYETQLISLEDRESNTGKWLSERVEALKKEISQTEKEITTVKECTDAYNKYEEAKKKASAQSADKSDTEKIKQALEARKEQYKIEESLQRLINNHANADALNAERDAALSAKEAAEKLANAELSNGEAVSKSSKYIKEGSKILEEHNRKMIEIESSVNSAIKSWAAFGSAIKNALSDSVRLFTTFNLSKMMTDSVRTVINTVRELDSAMTNIRLVTGQTREEVHKTIGVYSDLAKQLGDTTKNVAEGSIEWLRQGKTIEEATELMRSSTMLSKLGLMESSEATQQLTAILNGYKLEAEDAADVVSRLVNVDLIAATSTNELATSLQRVAAMAESSNISLDKMIGLIATGSETTRLSAETIGNSWKSILSRMQNVKAGKNIDEMGESIEFVA